MLAAGLEAWEAAVSAPQCLVPVLFARPVPVKLSRPVLVKLARPVL